MVRNFEIAVLSNAVRTSEKRDFRSGQFEFFALPRDPTQQSVSPRDPTSQTSFKYRVQKHQTIKKEMIMTTQKEYPTTAIIDGEEYTHLTTTNMAARYNISTDSIRLWKTHATFPKDATYKEGNVVFWSIEKVDNWLRSRKISRIGRPPVWLHIVDHPALYDDSEISGIGQ